jgi:hypothetical protein
MSSTDFASDLIKSICEQGPRDWLGPSLLNRKWLIPSDGSITPAVLELIPGNRTFGWPQDWHLSSRTVDGVFTLITPYTTFYTASKDGWVPYFTSPETAEINNEPGPHGNFLRISWLTAQDLGRNLFDFWNWLNSTPARPKTNGCLFSHTSSPRISFPYQPATPNSSTSFT